MDTGTRASEVSLPLALSLEDQRDAGVSPRLFDDARAEAEGADAAEVGVAHPDQAVARTQAGLREWVRSDALTRRIRP